MTDINIAYNNDYTQISNDYSKTNFKGDCINTFGNYFPKCDNLSAQWGNDTEFSDNNVTMNQKPCTKLFNNSTKRKSIVYYTR